MYITTKLSSEMWGGNKQLRPDTVKCSGDGSDEKTLGSRYNIVLLCVDNSATMSPENRIIYTKEKPKNKDTVKICI